MSYRDRGYSLIEVLVSVAILAIVMGGFLTLLDSSTKITKAQSAIADVQENVRYMTEQIVRTARMVGAGGVPPTVEDAGNNLVPVAVVVEDNVSGHTPIGGRTPLDGSDTLLLRGCFTNAVYDMDSSDYNYDPDTNSGDFKVRPTAMSGEPQDPSLLLDAVDAGGDPPKWAPVVFAAPADRPVELGDGHQRWRSQYGVAIVESTATVDGRTQFNFTTVATDPEKASLLALNRGGIFQAQPLSRVARVSLLMQYRYFVAKDEAGVPTLYVTTPSGSSAQPIVSDIVDLQVALGCDVNNNGTIETSASEPPALNDDEWVLNATGETVSAATPSGTPMIAYLTQLRLSLVARVPVADRSYSPPAPHGQQATLACENGRDILTDSYLGTPGRNFRYRSLTERIKLRSLGPILNGGA